MKTRLLMIGLMAVTAVTAAFALDDSPRIPSLKSVDVSTMTDSMSCSRLARYIMRQSKKTESSLRDADVILVVVRSAFNNPLNSSYDSIAELQDGVKGCFNMSGSKGHIYVYQIDENLKVTQIFHSGFQWTDALRE